MDESEYDAFGTGHSSTAISAVLGMAMAAKLDGNFNRNHIAIVGDGALTAGQAFEGLNNLSGSGTKMLLILNDNNRSVTTDIIENPTFVKYYWYNSNFLSELIKTIEFIIEQTSQMDQRIRRLIKYNRNDLHQNVS